MSKAKQILSFCCDRDFAEKLNQVTKQMNMSKSELIRVSLSQFLRKEKKQDIDKLLEIRKQLSKILSEITILLNNLEGDNHE